MERCDFSSVMTIIKRYISEDHGLNQIDFLYELFSGFLNDENTQDFDFDNGLVCKWMNGQARISPRISSYYHEPLHKKLLVKDIEVNILPLMYDIGMATQELHDLVSLDSSISEREKKALLHSYPTNADSDDAKLTAEILCFSMERTFVKRDTKVQKLLSSGSLSPVLQDFVLDGGIPKPCRTFCGREQELEALHAQLVEQGKVFLYGIAGIGKSELAKAYAWQHRKDYTNILHLLYPGDLKQMIVDMDFMDDQPDEDDAERFRRHNRFLRALKEDTLLIIDNFNTIAAKDELLSVVLKYRCRILFTTRSQFEQASAMQLTEISDKQALLGLVAEFYTKADQQPELMEQIIDTVHSHTLAVELAARLLENGILEPNALLFRLQMEHAALSTDTVRIQKDGQLQKATYYGHIHTLFCLYTLSAEQQEIMRCLSVVPIFGIRGRLFGLWLGLRNMDAVNDLVEMGFIQMCSGVIALHPMVQEISVIDMKPAVQSCRPLLDNLQAICLRHGYDVTYYKVMFQTVENFIQLAEKDDAEAYLLFLENVFPYMEKYLYRQGMEAVLSEIMLLLKDESVGDVKDRALLLDFQATCEERFNHRTEKAIKLEKEAVAMLTDISAETAHLAANLNANLGGLYHGVHQLDLARKHMEIAMHLLEKFNLTHTHDSIPIICTYANLITTMGEPERGFTALQKCAKLVKEYNSDQCADYAMIQEYMGTLCLQTLDVSRAKQYFQKALALYENLYAAEPDALEIRKQQIMSYYTQTGVNIGKLLAHT